MPGQSLIRLKQIDSGELAGFFTSLVGPSITGIASGIFTGLSNSTLVGLTSGAEFQAATWGVVYPRTPSGISVEIRAPSGGPIYFCNILVPTPTGCTLAFSNYMSGGYYAHITTRL